MVFLSTLIQERTPVGISKLGLFYKEALAEIIDDLSCTLEPNLNVDPPVAGQS